MNLISRLPLDNLEDRTDQIIVGLCRQGGAGSNHIAKSLLQRLPTTVVVHKLLSEEFLNTRSAKVQDFFFVINFCFLIIILIAISNRKVP